MLIHAEVFSPSLKQRMEHALVETVSGFIYEPVADRYFEKVELYSKYKIKELRRYTLEEAIHMAIKYKTYGPWDETNNSKGKLRRKGGTCNGNRQYPL